MISSVGENATSTTTRVVLPVLGSKCDSLPTVYNRPVSLSARVLAINALALAALAAVLFLAAQRIVGDSYRSLEGDSARLNVERAVRALSSQVSNLDGFVFDWAAWDDTYEFIEDVNEEYIDSNLVDATFIDSPVNVILYLDTDGAVVYGKAFDTSAEEEMPVPSDLLAQLAGGSTLLAHEDVESGVKGQLLTDAGLLLVASRPIVTSEVQGPIKGTLIMGRSLDSALVKDLAETTQLSLSLLRADDLDLPTDFREAIAVLGPETASIAKPFGSDGIAAYSLVNDVFGSSALIVRADMPRDISEQGRSAILYLLASVVLASVLFAAVTIVLLRTVLLSRLSRMSQTVRAIGETRELSVRVESGGRDELATLAASINEMLEEMERSQTERQQSQASLRELRRRLVDVEESERRNLARELHDEIGQDLTALQLSLEARTGSPEAMERALEKGRPLVADLVDRVRNLSLDLRPSMLDDMGLAAALDWLVRRHAESGLRVTFDQSGVNGSFATEIETTAYRVVQEGLTNVARHAKAGEATVKTKLDGGTLEITVADGGVGFEPSVIDGGSALGLAGMRERVELIGGSLRLDSAPGEGTTIQVTLPTEASDRRPR